MQKKSKLKILLAGTPNFAVPTFKKIIEHFDVIGLISQPNKPTGRTMIVTDTPTAMLAKFHRVKVFQPDKILDIYEELKEIDFDILLTMAYGQIIPQEILDLANIGSFNVHASLLPKYRGAAPIQYALLNGEKETGLTLMEMVSKMDSGDIIFQEKITIDEEDNYDTLLKKLSYLSSNNIVKWIEKIESNNFEKISQNESEVTYAPKISKDDERLQFDTMENSLRKIKALSSIPGAYIYLDTDQEEYKRINCKRVKIFKASSNFKKRALEVRCSDGKLYATEFQFEGKRKVVIE